MSSFAWLVRREFWETRAIWIAPAICGAILVVIALFGSIRLGDGAGDPDITRLAGDPEKLRAVAAIAIGALASAFVITALFTQFFYSLDSLYGERRDRSVLFWKSMPTTDVETVLSKLFVAAVAIPLVAIAIAVVVEPVVLGILSMRVGGLGSIVWTPSVWLNGLGLLLWLTFASVLWYLPWVAWLLAVSALAPRMPFLWAVLPPLAIALLEKGLFDSNRFWHAVTDRIGPGGLFEAAIEGVQGRGMAIVIDADRFDVPTSLLELAAPGRFFASPGLWIGLVVAAAFVAVAIWARRYRGEESA